MARARKADAKATEKAKLDQEKEDAQWQDDDKLVQKKMQRKNEQEQKRQQQLDKKVEKQKAYDDEMAGLESATTKAKQQQAPPKVTQAQIEREKQLEEARRKELESQRALEKKNIAIAPAEEEELPENVNRLQIEGEVAGTVEQAIEVLKAAEGGPSVAQDRHPEKRLKAAYTAFEEKRLPQLKAEHPTLRLSQLKQLLKKEWLKSPENPLNQKIMDIIK